MDRSVQGFQPIRKIATIYAGSGVIWGIPADGLRFQLELAVLSLSWLSSSPRRSAPPRRIGGHCHDHRTEGYPRLAWRVRGAVDSYLF
jgi:hypothetical protein